MLLRPTINQLYLLSIAPSNRPPHLKQPPSPNLPFSPSESIHQIIYPSSNACRCLPRQGFSIFSIWLPPPHFATKRQSALAPTPQGNFSTRNHPLYAGDADTGAATAAYTARSTVRPASKHRPPKNCTQKKLRTTNMKLYRFFVIFTKFFIKPRLNAQILFIATHGINRTHAIDRRPPYPSAPLI